jgi:hypothetical protein
MDLITLEHKELHLLERYHIRPVRFERVKLRNLYEGIRYRRAFGGVRVTAESYCT